MFINQASCSHASRLETKCLMPYKRTSLTAADQSNRKVSIGNLQQILHKTNQDTFCRRWVVIQMGGHSGF